MVLEERSWRTAFLDMIQHQPPVSPATVRARVNEADGSAAGREDGEDGSEVSTVTASEQGKDC